MKPLQSIRCAALCALIALTAQAQDGPLFEVRKRMRDNMLHLPDYTCVEKIERSERRPQDPALQLVDTVRLEVALVSGRELFSWPGAASFEERDIDRLIPLGMIGKGTFALHARLVFLGQPPQLTGPYEETEGGRRLLRWNYLIPAGEGRGWALRNGLMQGFAGIRGTFWADAETQDVIRLEADGLDIPTRLEIDGVHDSVTYTRVKIGEGSFLLPETAVMSMHTGQLETSNRVQFSKCRQYRGQSQLRFDEAAQRGEPVSAGLRRIELPPGTLLPLTLETPIRFGTTAAGDIVTFRLGRAITDGTTVLFPKGATVSARMTALRRNEVGKNAYMVGIDLLDIRSSTTEAPLHAILDESPGDDYTLLLFEKEWAGTSMAMTSGVVFLKTGGPEVVRAGTRMVWRIRRNAATGPSR